MKEKEEGTAIAVQNNQASIAAALSVDELQQIAVDFNSADLPSLANTKPVAVPLDIAYWTPAEGETKKCWVLGIDKAQVPDITTGDMKELECVFLVEEASDGTKARFMNGSKPLVGKIKAAMERNEIIPKTKRGAVEISFLGLKKNKRNNFNSHNWQILPLVFS